MFIVEWAAVRQIGICLRRILGGLGYMKRAIIGGFVSLVGSIWSLAVIISANNFSIDGWTTPPGKLLTQIAQSNLMPWFAVSILLVFLGIILMAVEFFRKDK